MLDKHILIGDLALIASWILAAFASTLIHIADECLTWYVVAASVIWLAVSRLLFREKK